MLTSRARGNIDLHANVHKVILRYSSGPHPVVHIFQQVLSQQLQLIFHQ